MQACLIADLFTCLSLQQPGPALHYQSGRDYCFYLLYHPLYFTHFCFIHLELIFSALQDALTQDDHFLIQAHEPKFTTPKSVNVTDR